MLESLTERFYEEGYRGDELMKMVYMAGYVGACMTNNEEAAAHYEAKLEAL